MHPLCKTICTAFGVCFHSKTVAMLSRERLKTTVLSNNTNTMHIVCVCVCVCVCVFVCVCVLVHENTLYVHACMYITH